MVQAIAFGLGYSVTFREDINEKCSAAELVIEETGKRIMIRRDLGKEFHVTVIAEDKSVKEFYSELDYSKALFETLRLNCPMLVSTSREATQPYISTLLPLFYLNQDNGYTEAYRAPRPFITDQFVEMVRFVFGLAPKHSFQIKKDLIAAKDALDAITKRIVYQQKVVADLAATTDDNIDTIAALDRQTSEFKKQLTQLSETITSHGSANSALADLLATKDQAIRSTKRSMDELRERVRGIAGIRSEIDGEIQTLALNEESKRVFESFSEICRNPQCGMFIGSSESYAKNLLYLKDQLKDLERNSERADIRLGLLQEQLNLQEAERKEVSSKMTAPGANNGVDQLMSAIQEITVALFNTEQRRTVIGILATAKSTYFRLEGERDQVLNRVANLNNAGRTDLDFNKLRIALRELVVKWLDILETRNVKRDVEIDLEFRFKFGGESLEAIAGSTKIRVVLAIHAALFELYLEDVTRPFRFMILDTPKQHEMHTGDLAEYLGKLSELCERSNAQLIFSSTEYRFPTQTLDAEWAPTYPGPKQPMYLGPAG
ncbi:MAG: hypothetical protein IH604_10740 [Burkholderiales bacterium]|nr:hypothetical protein [Burkholderiales bacterium]